MSTANPYEIEPAAPTDLEAVIGMLVECKLPADGLSEHFSKCLVARQGEAVAGCVALELYGASALLRSLAVDDGRRGTGLGKALTAAALDMAARQEVADVYLLTETAPDFFRRLGFQALERSDVPDAVKSSIKFATACPVTAQAMHLNIRER